MQVSALKRLLKPGLALFPLGIALGLGISFLKYVTVINPGSSVHLFSENDLLGHIIHCDDQGLYRNTFLEVDGRPFYATVRLGSRIAGFQSVRRGGIEVQVRPSLVVCFS